jgi:hypothetical protein
MKEFKLSESGARGWFIGDFAEAVFQTKDFEVGVQTNPRGPCASHYHADITEITLIVSGKVLTNGKLFGPGEGYILYPNDISQSEYLEETTIISVKTPSIPSDKYLL